jgi:hypothetical protein
MVGGFMVATVPTPPPGKGSDALFLGALALYTALCGWLLAFVASRALRRSGGGSRPQ